MLWQIPGERPDVERDEAHGTGTGRQDWGPHRPETGQGIHGGGHHAAVFFGYSCLGFVYYVFHLMYYYTIESAWQARNWNRPREFIFSRYQAVVPRPVNTRVETTKNNQKTHAGIDNP